jgi:hypothetical protein
MNWILNKCDAVGRYLSARGLTDYDPNETYSVGDRVQWGGGVGRTFVCVVASIGDGSGSNSPGNSPTKWAAWGSGIPAYRSDVDYVVNDVVFAPSDGDSYVCILANGHASPHEPHASPTYWSHWAHLDSDVVNLIQGNPNMTVFYSSTGISLTAGNVADVLDVRLGYSTIVRDLAFTLTNIPIAPGYVDVTLSAPIAFGSGIQNVQATSAVAPGVGAWAEKLGNNLVRIHCAGASGPNATAYVRLLGY